MPLKKFVTPLAIPPVLKPKIRGAQGTYYEVKMKQVKQKLHRDLQPTTVWGYNGRYPGPTIITHKNERVRVKWMNELPLKHLLPVDKTIPGAGPNVPEVRTVVHLHGTVARQGSDGNPLAWFSRDFRRVGPMFKQKVYDYPNRQSAATLFYHDHALAITRLNLYAGLAGAYLLRDARETSFKLPKGKFEIPLLIQDRSFKKNGQLFYPSNTTPPVKGVNPSIVPMFFGNTNLVNGTVWPYLNVEPRKYRFRMINGSNGRFYTMKLSSGQSFIQIGGDQGFLPKPVRIKELTLGPAERADVIIDFSRHKGQNIVLTNSARAPFPGGATPDPNTTGKIMQFRVGQLLTSPDKSRIPAKLIPISRLSPAKARRVRWLKLSSSPDKYGRQVQLLNDKGFMEPATQRPKLGSIEVWNFVNVGTNTHPMHLHLVHFQILSRRPFDVNYYNKTNKIRYTGPAVPPEPNERGMKDVVRVPPGYITKIIAKFVPYTGNYVWHCHILEHEDYDMMRPLKVVSGNRPLRRK
ncbi:multicopper oxidase family protein [Paenibacillus kribbensis]|uniref:multicopper oxidase family protein n=1 Tax=Paenibacillus kribbensis TaxID=172713 RepID=UPI000838D7AE|nr:multicopper oxidase [Paenibacillus kribbensis]